MKTREFEELWNRVRAQKTWLVLRPDLTAFLFALWLISRKCTCMVILRQFRTTMIFEEF
jgi:hypothetical protein